MDYEEFPEEDLDDLIAQDQDFEEPFDEPFPEDFEDETAAPLPMTLGQPDEDSPAEEESPSTVRQRFAERSTSRRTELFQFER